MESTPHSHSLVGIGGALIFSWTVSRSVGQRPQRRRKALSGDVKFTSCIRCQHSSQWHYSCCSAIYQVFPFGKVELVDVVRKGIGNLIRSIFWVDFCLLIHPRQRLIYRRKELLVSSFLPFFPPRAGMFLRFWGFVL